MRKLISGAAAVCLVCAGATVMPMPASAFSNVVVVCDTADVGSQYVFTCSGKGGGVTVTNAHITMSKTGPNGQKLGPLVGSKAQCLYTNLPASLDDCKPWSN